ncbi:MAG TPA: hypothetical protein VIU33_03230, partial [Nitrospiria bacterium]
DQKGNANRKQAGKMGSPAAEAGSGKGRSGGKTGLNPGGQGPGGKARMASQRPGSGSRGGASSAPKENRFGQRDTESIGVIGKEPIPVFVQGVRKGDLVGDALNEKLENKPIQIRRGVRRGWDVSDALQMIGVTDPVSATFIDRKGASTTVNWPELSGSDKAFLLSYNNGGQLVLLSGAVFTGVMPSQQRGQGGGRATRQSGGVSGEVAVTDIVKIELAPDGSRGS